MKLTLEVCLIALAIVLTKPLMQAQVDSSIPLRRGISVHLPTTTNAVRVPEADKEDAVIVAITYNGTVYLQTDPIALTKLAEKLSKVLSNRPDKTVYLKADARVSYANVVMILDALETAGATKITLLTDQRDSEQPGTLMSPKGLEMQVVRTSGHGDKRGGCCASDHD